MREQVSVLSPPSPSPFPSEVLTSLSLLPSPFFLSPDTRSPHQSSAVDINRHPAAHARALRCRYARWYDDRHRLDELDCRGMARAIRGWDSCVQGDDENMTGGE